ncbi:MAG TPA: isoprenyl transferase [Symbiobacteriaceae bacterium]
MLDRLRRWVGLGREKPVANEEARPLGAGPRHVAVIMDGNGRWALRRGLPRTAGHRAGVEALKGIVRACPDLGIEILTAYAFSTENWKRDKDEVDFLMNLLVEYCRSEVDTLNANGVRIRAIGRIDELPELQRSEIRRAMELTQHNNRLILNLAVNYGSHAELVDAMRSIAREVQAGLITPDEIDESVVERHLYTAGLPAPDLVIRTGGEMRLSNFLLWQASYSEIWVSDVAWPDFRPEHLERAIRDFQRRERRFGAVLPQSR